MMPPASTYSMQTRGSMRMAAVNVLGMPSKKESLIIHIRDLREVVGSQVSERREGSSQGRVREAMS